MAVLAAASLGSASRLLGCVLHLQLHLQHGLSSGSARLRARRGSSAGAVGTSPPAPAAGTAGTAERATRLFRCSPAHAGLSALPAHPLPWAMPTMGAARQEPLHGFTKAGTASGDGAFSPWAERGTFPAGSVCSRALGGRTAGFGSLEMVVTPAEIVKTSLQVPGWRGGPCCGAVRWPGSCYLRLAAGRSPGHRPSHCPISRGCGPWPVSAQARFPQQLPAGRLMAHRDTSASNRVSVPLTPAPGSEPGCSRHAKHFLCHALFSLAESKFCFLKKVYLCKAQPVAVVSAARRARFNPLAP